ncbi:hypothetical protein Trydic_g13411 [Trypoxylus dichotomus]
MDILVRTVALLEEKVDPRAKGYFLINSPLQIFGTVVVYLVFSVWIGPALMQSRKPFNLHRVLQAYNLLQIILCTSFTTTAIPVVRNAAITFVCDPITSNTDYWTQMVIKYHWYYFLLKLLDLLDTVFFVLRKKNNQISFLHLYHHAGMFVISWAFTAFFPSGQSALTGMLNCFVHIWMYGYYFIASLGPNYAKYLKYKIHITQLQMAQFLILFLQALMPFTRDCGFPKPVALLMMVQAMIFIYLFGKFYINTFNFITITIHIFKR